MKTVETVFPVEGMTCASCAGSVQSYLAQLDGVVHVESSYAAKSVKIAYQKDRVNAQMLRDHLKEINYDLIIEDRTLEETEEAESRRLRQTRNRLWLAMILALPSVLLGMVFTDIPYRNEALMLLSFVVLFYSGKPFFINAAKRALHLTANMDTLVAMGTGIAFLFSAFNTIFPGFFISRGLEPHTYYESAVMIIALIILGKYLEDRAGSSASSAINKLIRLGAKTAHVLREGKELSIPAEQIVPGDEVIIRPGEKIPVDGRIIKGSANIDESTITGEPLPVYKTTDDMVISGTVNRDGVIRFRAERVGSDTLLAGIIRMVREARASSAPVQKTADRVAAVFVPIVILIALAAMATWLLYGEDITHAMLALVSTLIIACPCALGLATPTAIMVGIGKGATQGILIRNAESLEKTGVLNAILLDKTGTITMGKPKVEKIVWHEQHAHDALLKNILFSIEMQSEHPLSNAITEYLQAEELSVERFRNIPGRGVQAHVNGEKYVSGNEAMIRESACSLSLNLKNAAKSMLESAQTVVYFAANNKVLAVIGIHDPLKEGAVKSIRSLQAMGMRVVMLTGDNERTAAVIAGQAGIDEYRAGMLPEDKMRFVEQLQKNGLSVGMVGDGINDAPALARADVGIAMGTGTDIAMESASLTLLKGDLARLVSAVRLSRATMKTIRQNLFWAFFYNVVAIPVAAGALYPVNGFLLNPVIAGAAMAFSSVSVVTNSLRLKKKKI